MEEMLLDVDSALELMGGDKDFLKELLTELVHQVEEELPAIQQAVDSSDISSIKRIAHGLKGASANLNAKRFAAQFLDFEKLCATGNLDGSQNLIQNIKSTNSELKQLIGTL